VRSLVVKTMLRVGYEVGGTHPSGEYVLRPVASGIRECTDHAWTTRKVPFKVHLLGIQLTLPDPLANPISFLSSHKYSGLAFRTTSARGLRCPSMTHVSSR
jgi:hypothetical protein